MKRFSFGLSLILGTAVLLVLALPAAQTSAQGTDKSPVDCEDSSVTCLVNPIGGTKGEPTGEVRIPVILGNVVARALTILGSAALLMFVVGGFMWLTSAGNSDQVKKGTQTMLWAAIGVLVIFSSYAILSLVLRGLGVNNAQSGIKSSVAATIEAESYPLILIL